MKTNCKTKKMANCTKGANLKFKTYVTKEKHRQEHATKNSYFAARESFDTTRKKTFKASDSLPNRTSIKENFTRLIYHERQKQ